MGVYIVYISFTIFIITLLIIIIYFITSIIFQWIEKKRIYDKTFIIKRIMNRHLKYEHLDNISNEEIIKLREEVKTKVGLQAFYICFKIYIRLNYFSENLYDYINLIVDYELLAANKIARKTYKDSYLLFLLSEFRLYSQEIEQFTLKALQSSSIYTRNNALKVIKNSGNINFVINAIYVLNSSKHYYNFRILVDFIDSFTGDIHILDKFILGVANKLTKRLQRLIIVHFSNVKNKDQETRNYLLDKLANSYDKELIIVATRYFGEIFDERAAEFIIKNLESKDWEIRSVSAKNIIPYNNEIVQEKLIKGINDNNYFVSYNSAYSFITIFDKHDILDKYIFNIKSNAREIVFYAMHERGIINSYEYSLLMGKTEVSQC